jgi:hypothetical protein
MRCDQALQVLRVSHSVALHNKTEIAGNLLGYGDMRDEVLNGTRSIFDFRKLATGH